MEQPDRPSDEAILQFEQSIRNAEVENRPLVDVLEPRVNLKHEYERGSPQFLEKIDVGGE